MPQSKRQIQEVLNSAGIRPLKRYGQHFLIDGNLMTKLVAAAEVGPDDVVLEVGPGTGSLTEVLLAQVGHVVAVEIDRGLHAVLQQRLASAGNLTLLHTDVLETKSRIAPTVLEALAGLRQRFKGRTLLVANLPYQVATPLLLDLLREDLILSPLCFTVQAEVADRFLAAPGGKEYGPAGIFIQALTTIRRIARVPPGAFWPVPQVDSAMLRLDRKADDRPSPATLDALFKLVHACFQHRRKTMRWSLGAVLDDATFDRIEASGMWRLEERPERVSVENWIRLAEFVVELGSSASKPTAGEGEIHRPR